jgi:apolipoprotein N-acyltransferase
LALAGSAYLMALAMESPQRVWLGWVTLLPLFFAIRVLSPARAFVCGAFWGACLFVFSFAFAQTAISPTPGSFILLALIPAIYAYLGAALTRRVGFSPYLMALGWIGVELALRPLGLHYGLLAGTQGDGLVIRAVGSFAGYVLVAFLVAWVNATLVSVLSEVRLSFSAPRLVRKAIAAERRFVVRELPSYLLHLLRAAQPRAPPQSG